MHMHTQGTSTDDSSRELTDKALDAARSLAQAIGESEVFRRFEAALDAFQADQTTQARLRAYQLRQRELSTAAMWGGASDEEQRALAREWQDLSQLETLQGYLQAQEAMRTLFRDVTARITEAIGVDYGAACAPAGGCC